MAIGAASFSRSRSNMVIGLFSEFPGGGWQEDIHDFGKFLAKLVLTETSVPEKAVAIMRKNVIEDWAGTTLETRKMLFYKQLCLHFSSESLR
jgi:hypothetical protein